jgi:hypothetical protein
MTSHQIKVNFNLYEQTLGSCIKELIETASSIYKVVKKAAETNGPISLVCGGQSPAYFALSMLNLPIYDPEKVDIIVLPHSKGGHKGDCSKEARDYRERIINGGIKLRKTVYILDTVHSGVGINSLESVLAFSYPSTQFRKISINHPSSPPQIPVDIRFKAACVPRLSDSFPRIVMSCQPHLFNSRDITNGFVNLENNPYATMIKEMSSVYNKINIEEMEWFKLNNCRQKN